VPEVYMQAMAKKITWIRAAEVLGVTDRTMRRWKGEHEEMATSWTDCAC
jgi:hypothetical protein